MNKSLIFALIIGMAVLSTSGWAYTFDDYGEYTGFNFSVATEETAPKGLTYYNNKFYVVGTGSGTGNDKVFEYYTNGTYTGFNFSVATQISIVEDITVYNNKFYILDLSDKVYEYNSTGSYTGFNFSTNDYLDNPAGITYYNDKFYVVGYDSDKVFEYYTNGTYTGFNFSVATEETAPKAITTYNDKLYIFGYDSDKVFEYYTNGTYTGFNFSVATHVVYEQGLTYYNNKFYALSSVFNRVYEYNALNKYNFTSETLSYETNTTWFDTNTIASTLVYDTDYSNISATLEYNGTNYTMARSGTDGTYVFSYDKNFATATSGNKNFKIYYAVTYGTTTTYTGDTYTQTVNSPALYVCNATYTTHAVDFFIYDEVDKTDKIAKLEGSFLVYGNNISNNATYNFTFTGDNNYSLCITPTYESMFTYAQLQYYNKTTTVYQDRSYFLVNASLSNTSTQLNLYLSNNTSQIFFNIIDEFANPYIDAVVKAQRYYLAEDTYRTVAMGRTDDNGDTFMYLMPNTIWYRFIVEKDGEVIKTFTPMLLTSTDVSLPIATIEASNLFEYWNTIGYSCSYSNTTEFLTCIVSDTSGKLTLSTLLVYDTTAGTETLICNETSVSTSTTLYCELPDVTNKQYTYNLYGNFCCSTETIYSMTNGVLDFFDGVGLGTMGMFATFLIVLVLAGIGIFNPAISIALTVIGLIAMATLGFLDTTTTAIAGITVVGVIIISKLGS